MNAHDADDPSDRAVPTLSVDRATSLSDLMREHTQELHVRAERAGVINDILRGRASRFGYALLLRNLLPAYTALEFGLELRRDTPAVRPIAEKALYRSSAIKSDLAQIFGSIWEKHLPLLPCGQRYGRRIDEAASGSGTLLIAHAYTRYLGDLNGGQIMKRLLAKSLGLQPEELSFFDFDAIADGEAFKKQYRRAFNECGPLVADIVAVVVEAKVAFGLNIAIAEEVQRAASLAAV
jgi:heme oxygenase (biliverdin-producing, ferredoxin)